MPSHPSLIPVLHMGNRPWLDLSLKLGQSETLGPIFVSILKISILNLRKCREIEMTKKSAGGCWQSIAKERNWNKELYESGAPVLEVLSQKHHRPCPLLTLRNGNEKQKPNKLAADVHSFLTFVHRTSWQTSTVPYALGKWDFRILSLWGIESNGFMRLWVAEPFCKRVCPDGCAKGVFE